MSDFNALHPRLEAEQGSGKTPAYDSCDSHGSVVASAHKITKIATIAALYAAATLVVMLCLSGFAWGPIQFRVSEALCVLALFFPEAIVGLTFGCVLANLINIVLSASGFLGLLDVVFGSVATCIGALFTWRFRKHTALALLGPVVANALIVPAYLPLILQGLGFYTVPFTDIALDGSYLLMYLFGIVVIGLGEACVVYILGLPLVSALKRAGSERFTSA